MKDTIVTDPQILFGKPVVAGTRVSVELILDKLGAGDSYEDILADYPHLTRDSILAAVRFGPVSRPGHSADRRSPFSIARA